MLKLLVIHIDAHLQPLGLSNCFDHEQGTVLVQGEANFLQNGSYIYGISSMGGEAKKALADGMSWEEFSKRASTVPA